MARFSQLVEFAKNRRQMPEPGIEVVVTPQYLMQFMADFPIPGPNHATWVRCKPEQMDDVIREATAQAEARRLPFCWILDPDTQPPEFGQRLADYGFAPEEGDEKAAVMVLSTSAELDMPSVDGLEIRMALADMESFAAAEKVAAEAFAGVEFGQPTGLEATQEGRFANMRVSGNRHMLLATVDGEPAGSGSIALFPPDGAVINGGAVRPKFRGRGVYRAMVAYRLGLARKAGVAGLVVWGGHMSGPILERLGFETVSWRSFYQPVAPSGE